eukprot:GHUV01038103.1.p2 GENE.GHUV01038103.1~~GHUV01038103.1.p2  ORF type:complete len:102 (-),score=34.64 GHUV01038103.1:1281-1586(-)
MEGMRHSADKAPSEVLELLVLEVQQSHCTNTCAKLRGKAKHRLTEILRPPMPPWPPPATGASSLGVLLLLPAPLLLLLLSPMSAAPAACCCCSEGMLLARL